MNIKYYNWRLYEIFNVRDQALSDKNPAERR